MGVELVDILFGVCVSGSFHENLATSGARDFGYFLTIFLRLENGGIENSEMTVGCVCCVVLCV